MKVENTQDYSAEECDDINKQHEAMGFDFKVEPQNTQKNKALRAIAKLCLNSQ